MGWMAHFFIKKSPEIFANDVNIVTPDFISCYTSNLWGKFVLFENTSSGEKRLNRAFPRDSSYIFWPFHEHYFDIFLIIIYLKSSTYS